MPRTSEGTGISRGRESLGNAVPRRERPTPRAPEVKLGRQVALIKSAIT